MFIWLQLTRTYKGNQKGSSYRGTWFLLTSLITWSLTERTDTFFATGHQGITEKKKLTQSTTDQPLQKYISSLQILFEIWLKKKFNVMDWLCFDSWEVRFELSREKLQRKWPEGRKKIASSCREVQVIEDKIMVNVWRKSRENQLWFKQGRTFRVTGSQLYSVPFTGL